MNDPASKNFTTARLAFATLTIVAIIFITIKLPPPNCQSIRLAVFQGGTETFLSLIVIAALLSLLLTPMNLIAFVMGILVTPGVSVGIVLSGIFLSVILSFSLGRVLGPQHPLIKRMTHVFQGKLWFNDMLQSSAGDGMKWSREQSKRFPLPVSIFSLYNAATIPHLSWVSLCAGVVGSSLLPVITFGVAGSTIGCGLINYSNNLSIERQIPSIALSIGLLFLVSRYQQKAKS